MFMFCSFSLFTAVSPPSPPTWHNEAPSYLNEPAGHTAEETVDESWSKRELRTECFCRGIRNFTRLSKYELIRLLNHGGGWMEMQLGLRVSPVLSKYLCRATRDHCRVVSRAGIRPIGPVCINHGVANFCVTSVACPAPCVAPSSLNSRRPAHPKHPTAT